MTITIPYPPSANAYWRHNNNRTHRSHEAVKFINQVGQICIAESVKPTAELVRVVITVYRPAKRGDLDNTLKVLLDSLRGYAFVDDAQVIEIHALRLDDKENPRAVVTIEPFQKEAV